MDLVDEEQRALARLAPAAGDLEDLLEVGDAGEDRRNLLEMKVGLARQQPRDGGLAGARRPPEDQRTERAGGEHPRQRAVGTEQMVLADDVVQPLRPQAIGKRRGGALPLAAAFASSSSEMNRSAIAFSPRFLRRSLSILR